MLLVKLASSLVNEPFVMTMPEVVPPPNTTLMLPAPLAERLLLPVIVKQLSAMLSVIRRPLVAKVIPAIDILLSTVMSRFVSEPSVITSPVVAGVAVEHPRITLTVPIFD